MLLTILHRAEKREAASILAAIRSLTFLLVLLLQLEGASAYIAEAPAKNLETYGQELLANITRGPHMRPSYRGPAYIKELGVEGVNYELDAEGRPFIWCEVNSSAKDGQPAGSSKMACYSDTKFHRIGCMAVVVHRKLHAETSTLPSDSALSMLKGCWSQADSEFRECKRAECSVEFHRGIEPTPLFCCCRTHMCNAVIDYADAGPFNANIAANNSISDQISSSVEQTAKEEPSRKTEGLFLLLLAIGGIATVCLVYFSVRRRQLCTKKAVKQLVPPLLWKPNNNDDQGIGGEEADENLVGNEAEGSDGGASSPPTFHFRGSTFKVEQVNITERIAGGRFGEVHKALIKRDFGGGEEGVVFAAKSLHSYESWLTEREIYEFEAVRTHPNIVEFVAAYQLTISRDERSFILLTVYYDHGSLHDYLRGHTLSLREAGRIALSFISGLAFLHEETTTPPKPPIVHRDFKSKNVLVKPDLTACITDFGLALKCDERRFTEDDNHGQIGTRRYMAPELLEGATDFTIFAFQQLDVYAAALVLWEVLSRTRLPECGEGSTAKEYALPYECEAGPNPTLGKMRELVVVNRFRPLVPPYLLGNEHTNLMVRTMVEMWDLEPDGRITSGCARDRLLRICTSLEASEVLPACP